jgi:hypothetical protein
MMSCRSSMCILTTRLPCTTTISDDDSKALPARCCSAQRAAILKATASHAANQQSLFEDKSPSLFSSRPRQLSHLTPRAPRVMSSFNTNSQDRPSGQEDRERRQGSPLFATDCSPPRGVGRASGGGPGLSSELGSVKLLYSTREMLTTKTLQSRYFFAIDYH